MRVRTSVLPVPRTPLAKMLSVASGGLVLGALLMCSGQVRAASLENGESASALQSTAVNPTPVSATYDIYFGGFHVLTADAQWERSARGYQIAGEAETQGMIGWLNPWKGNTESRGRLADGKVIPQSFVSHGTSSKGDKLVRLSYDPQGELSDSIVQPEQDGEDRYPLPPDAAEDTLDPLSVIAGLSEILRKTGRCEGKFPVFDGRKRYDLTVSDAGVKQLEPTDYSIYAGPAHGCRLDYTMLGGQRVERNKYAETARERIVWVARPMEGAPLIPVRLEIDTAYGTVMGHLTGFEQGAQMAEKSGTKQPGQINSR